MLQFSLLSLILYWSYKHNIVQIIIIARTKNILDKIKLLTLFVFSICSTVKYEYFKNFLFLIFMSDRTSTSTRFCKKRKEKKVCPTSSYWSRIHVWFRRLLVLITEIQQKSKTYICRKWKKSSV